MLDIEAWVLHDNQDGNLIGWPSFRFRKAGYQAIDRICDYYYSLEKQPVVSQVQPGYLREALPGMLRKHARSIDADREPDSAPSEGEDFQIIQDDYQKFILPGKVLQRPLVEYKFKWLARCHTLAASVLLCILPDGIHVWRYDRGSLHQ